MSGEPELTDELRRAIDTSDATRLVDLSADVCRFVVDNPALAEVKLAGQAALFDAALPRLTSDASESRLAIADLRNAIGSVTAGATPSGDQTIRAWLRALARRDLPPGQRVRVGFAALALEDYFLASTMGDAAPSSDDVIQRLTGLLADLVRELTGPRHPIMFRLGTTARAAIRRSQPLDAVNPGTLLWIGRIVHAGIMQLAPESSASGAAWKIQPWHDDAAEREQATIAMHEFPFGERILGRYTIGERAQGIGHQQLWLASDDTGRTALVARDGKVQRQTLDQLRSELRAPMRGGVELLYAGHVDQPVQQTENARLVESTWVVAETCAEGDWLPSVLPRVQDPQRAVRMALELGVSAGRLVQRAAEGGVLLLRVRPEYIWAAQRGEHWEVTGVSDRGDRLFALASYTASSHPLFDRYYYAPEHRRAPSERSLVYTLAVMIAEWATGRYPFPTRWPGRGLEQADHVPLAVPDALRELLESALRLEPMQRPSLGDFVQALANLA